jgi:hypothetical protein
MAWAGRLSFLPYLLSAILQIQLKPAPFFRF